jgi:hypothetical protein
VQPELGGFLSDPAFETWRPISTTDCGDDNMLRFALGNEAAVKTAHSDNMSPWQMARFVKFAWQQEAGPDKLAHTGKFIQWG